MSKSDTSDLEFIKIQIEYLSNIRRQIEKTGEYTLSVDDVMKIDMIAQSLNSIRLLLAESHPNSLDLTKHKTGRS